MHDRVLGVAAHVDDLEIRPHAEQSVGEGAPIHARHHHVGQQQVDAACVAGRDFHRLDAIAGRKAIVCAAST